MSILFYEKGNPYYEFSNFYPSPITLNNSSYPTVEHFFQAQKFLGPNASTADREYALWIMTADTPNKAFILANQRRKGGYAANWNHSKNNPVKLNDLITTYLERGAHPREDWESVKDNIMRQGIWAKFTQNPNLTNTLIGTGNNPIAENSPRDAYWGIGSDGSGLNMLGKILMEARTFLSGNYPPAPTANSNWVIPGVLLASAYPGKANLEEHRAVVNTILASPINMIVSLQLPAEERQYNSYRQIIDPNFVEPEGDFIQMINTPKTMVLTRFSIEDRKITTDEKLISIVYFLIEVIGKKYSILIHCLGGKGRTGTVMAVLLGKLYNMTAQNSLAILARSFDSRMSKGKRKRSMPQTKVQFDQVYRLLAN